MYRYETADGAYYSILKDYSDENRNKHTTAETIVWDFLRSKHLGVKFRRQHIIGQYIVDFVCLPKQLVIEIDGKYHFYLGQQMDDAVREKDLQDKGYKILRFTNEEVIGNAPRVIMTIKNELMSTLSSNNLSSNLSSTTLSAPTQQHNSSPVSASPLLGRGSGGGFRTKAWAVDAACSGNPGRMEYQGVDLQTGARIFHFGPMYGTNNIGEFLAIVHALALMEQQGIRDKVIYSDSYNAILWVNKKKCKTTLERNVQTERLYQIIARAENWLLTHVIQTPILKWETSKWGEIPADFGRKK